MKRSLAERKKGVEGLRALLLLNIVVLSGCTALVISNHGWNLLTVFFGDLGAMNWPGQFDPDFMGFRSLSALWTYWQRHFSAPVIAPDMIVVFRGMVFLTVCLLAASYQVKGSVKALLLGSRRAAGGNEGTSKTKAAMMACLRRPAKKVEVFQWRCGA